MAVTPIQSGLWTMPVDQQHGMLIAASLSTNVNVHRPQSSCHSMIGLAQTWIDEPGAVGGWQLRIQLE